MLSQSDMARALGISQPAVAKLKKRGMPLSSVEDAEAWRTIERQRTSRAKTAPKVAPVAAKPKKSADVRTNKKEPAPRTQRLLNRASVAPSGESKTGAEHALTRLEAEEIAAYDRLQTALAELDDAEDPSTALVIAANAKLAREDWLKVSESLRKYDLLVEASRRDSGQLIPRLDSEIAVEMAALWLRLAVRTFIGSYVERIIKAGNNPPAVVRLIEDGMGAAVNTSLLRCTGCRVPLQPWAIAAVRRGYGNGGDLSLDAVPTPEADDDAG